MIYVYGCEWAFIYVWIRLPLLGMEGKARFSTEQQEHVWDGLDVAFCNTSYLMVTHNIPEYLEPVWSGQVSGEVLGLTLLDLTWLHLALLELGLALKLCYVMIYVWVWMGLYLCMKEIGCALSPSLPLSLCLFPGSSLEALHDHWSPPLPPQVIPSRFLILSLPISQHSSAHLSHCAFSSVFWSLCIFSADLSYAFCFFFFFSVVWVFTHFNGVLLLYSCPCFHHLNM